MSQVGSVQWRIDRLISSLGNIYTQDGVLIWLTSRHRLLDNRSPLAVMITDPFGLAQVETLIEQLETGAFT